MKSYLFIFIVIHLFASCGFPSDGMIVDGNIESQKLLKRLKETRLPDLQIREPGIEHSILKIKQTVENGGAGFCPIVLKMEPAMLSRPVSILGAMTLHQAFEALAQQADVKIYLKLGVVYFVDSTNDVNGMSQMNPRK